MSPFGTRGAADELARLLDGAASDGSAAAVQGAALAARLRDTGAALDAAVVPRADFRAALRTRLVAVATVQAATAATAEAPERTPARTLDAAVSWRSGRRAQRGAAVAAGALASVVAVSGVAVAGSQSLPGDPFYGVKRTTEALQLRAADGDVEKGTRHLDLAATRLREVRGLTLGREALTSGPALGTAALSGVALRSADAPVADGEPADPDVAERVRQTLAEMDDETRRGSELLTEAYRASREREPLQALSRFASRQTEGLQQLLPALPEAAQARAQVSLALVTGVAEQASGLLAIGVCGDACDPASAAPSVPVAPAPDGTTGTTTSAPCGCEEPTPAPAPQASAEPVDGADEPAPAPEPQPADSDSPASPSPAPTGSSEPSTAPSSDPLPTLPVPVPVPSASVPVPVPVPTITVPPVDPEALLPTLAPLSGPAPEPADAPVQASVPLVAPLAPRP